MGINLFGTLEEHQTTIRDVVRAYAETIHVWLPIVSESLVLEAIKIIELLGPDDNAASLLILAMHLLTYNNDSLTVRRTLYDTCRYFFFSLLAADRPTIALIQAGLLLALFEHLQCIEEREYATIGICARLISLEGIGDMSDDLLMQSEGLSIEMEEKVRIYWGTLVLDR